MHRAILISIEDEIEESAIHLTAQKSSSVASIAAKTVNAASQPVDNDADSSGDGQKLAGRTVAEVEKELILNTLDQCLGNRTHAANILGISIRTLRNKLKQYNDEGAKV